MRVCTPNGSNGTSNKDHYGNKCTPTVCGLGTTTDQYFGGCGVDSTARTLCCAN
jgi:hypothetical protein